MASDATAMSLDAQLLMALRENPGGISSVDLAHKLGLSTKAVSAHVEDLRSLGYDIESSPHAGYRLVTVPDALHPDDLMSRLGKVKVIGRDIRVFQETTSTNDIIERFARDGLREGIVVFAEAQTHGRGRLGRRWISPAKKGLWFSILLRPEMRPQETTQLTIASAIAVRRAIVAQTGLAPEIKWPNDLLLEGRKVCGILTELHAELDRVKYIILGIGVDVNLEVTDLPPDLQEITTSLKAILGKPVSRPDLAVHVLRELDRDYQRICSGRFAEVADEWEAHCTTLGHELVILTGKRQIRGRAESLGEDGALLVRTEHGHLERIMAGDVTLEK
jgi:BirA family transcriptional regulator, biotin operon repressor / biotin---[acetyl-CoA-carboxylase] ligase